VKKKNENISKDIETISLLRKRNIEFTKKETLHSIKFHDDLKNKKISTKIISKKHSINGHISIFIDPLFIEKIDNEDIKGINSEMTDLVAFASYPSKNIYNIFINNEKLKKREREIDITLNHELQHVFDYYIGNMYPNNFHNMFLIDYENVNWAEYRAKLAEIIFSEDKKAMEAYAMLERETSLFEREYYKNEEIYNDFIKGIYSKKIFYEQERPHLWAGTKIIRELNNLSKKDRLFDNEIEICLNGFNVKKIKRKCKKLLDLTYKKIIGKTYNEILEELKEIEIKLRGD
jgi:hypothetical protein